MLHLVTFVQVFGNQIDELEPMDAMFYQMSVRLTSDCH